MPATLTLTSKVPIVSNVWLFTFQPSVPISWQAGQFIRVELPHDRPDQEGTKRYFTVASAPADGHVQIATRLTSSTFKQALGRLPVGGELRLLDLPAGDFTWPQDHSRPLVFAAQGIGITPVRSLLRQRLHDGRPLSATLFYANLTPGVPFADELNHWARHPEFKFHLLGQPITAGLLAAHEPNLPDAHVYVTGPRSLIELLAPPINLPISRLKQDQFPNYAAGDY